MNVPIWVLFAATGVTMLVLGGVSGCFVMTLLRKRDVQTRLATTEEKLATTEAELTSTEANLDRTNNDLEACLTTLIGEHVASQFWAGVCLSAYHYSAGLVTRLEASEDEMNRVKSKLTETESERDLFKEQRDKEAGKYEWAYPQWREDSRQRQYHEELSTGYARELKRRDDLVARLAKELETAKNDRERIAAYQRFAATATAIA